MRERRTDDGTDDLLEMETDFSVFAFSLNDRLSCDVMEEKDEEEKDEEMRSDLDAPFSFVAPVISISTAIYPFYSSFPCY